LDQAKRPVIIVGSDVARSDAGKALHSFITGSGIPVFSDYEALGVLSGCPHSGGLLQNLYTFDDKTGRPDVVLMLGVRFGLNTSHGTGLLVSHQARVIQVDSDARELGRLQSVSLAVVADPGEMVCALNAAATGRRWRGREEWQETVRKTIAARRRRVDSLAKEETPIHPMRAVAAIATQINSDTIVVADGALSYLWLSEVISAAQPRAFLCHGYLGSMGVGTGIALGAQVAARGGRVLLVTGDGSIGYSLGEFDTMVRAGLPIVVVVMNNRSWGATLHFQRMVGGPDRVTNTYLENGNYEDVAKALGARGVSVTKESEIAPAISVAFDSGVATCINVRVGLDAVPPEEMILMGQNPFC
jgi:acetolactate synthase-1/2/3 large subunit